MLVCHCRVVNDTTVRAAVADGARTVADVARRCGAARECGGCAFAVREVIAQAGDDIARHDIARQDEALRVTAAA